MMFTLYQQPLRLLLAYLSLLSFYAGYSSAGSESSTRVLIYSATQGFRHDSIPTAIQALKEKGPSVHIQFDNTEDENQFTDSNLASYDAIIFLSTTGEVLQASGKAAFQNYLTRGGNFVGIHSASDSLLSDAFYGREIGAYFDYHPPLQNATINVLDRSHPSTTMLPARWKVQDEMYNFKSDPRALGATVILSADESTYTDDGERKFNQGSPHPTAWYQERGAGVEEGGTAGRSFYTSLGHLNETWRDELFIAHVLGGIQWALQSNNTRKTGESSSGNSTGEGTEGPQKLPSGSIPEYIPPNPLSLTVICLFLILTFSQLRSYLHLDLFC